MVGSLCLLLHLIMKTLKNAPESIFPTEGQHDSQGDKKTSSSYRRAKAGTPLKSIPHGILSGERRHALRKECGSSLRFSETLRRAHLVFRAIELQYSGTARSQFHAARLLKVPRATLFRYQDSLFKKGLAGLIPGKSSGRPLRFPRPAISQEEINAMVSAGDQSHAIKRIRVFMNSPICRDELREYLEKNIPKSLIAKIQSLIRTERLPAPWLQASTAPNA